MVSKILTNLTQDKFVLHYSHDGQSMIPVVVEPFALNQDVMFYDDASFESFLNQHKNLFETEQLVHSQKLKESKAQAINERNENAEFARQVADKEQELREVLAPIQDGEVKIEIEDRLNKEVVASMSVVGGSSTTKKGKK